MVVLDTKFYLLEWYTLYPITIEVNLTSFSMVSLIVINELSYWNLVTFLTIVFYTFLKPEISSLAFK